MDWIIVIVVAAHAGAALKHHLIDKDDILLRMIPAWAGGKK
jgi:cytochrome b561